HEMGLERLRRLEGLLKKTDWLAAPHQKRPVLHPTKYSLTLKRAGQTRTVDIEGDLAEPYAALVSFFRDIAEQEHLVYRLQLGSAKGSYQACAQIEHYVLAVQGGRYAKPPAELDLARYVPACQLFVRDAYRHSREEVAPGVRLLGHLRVESDREYIAALANDRDMNVRIAVAEALGALGGNESVPVLRRMIHSTSEAAWELIKLGPLAIPTIVEVIGSGTDPFNERKPGFLDYEKVIRAYIDHWDAAPKPLDPRVLEAVKKSMAVPKIKAHRIQYHKKLLELAEPPKSEKEAPESEATVVTAASGILLARASPVPRQMRPRR